MTNTNPGAVFFLGTRAHYQVLNPPDTISFDIENANASLEAMYQNPSPMQENDNLISPKSEDFSEAGNIIRQWSCKNEYSSEMTLLDREETENCIFGSGLTQRRAKRRDNGSSDFIMNDNDDIFDIDPTALNVCDRDSPKFKIKAQSRRCMNIRALLANLKVKRNKRKLSDDQHGVDNAISMCTYKDSCRCLDCQCRYFECDESEYSDDDSVVDFTPQPMFTHTLQVPIENAETSTPAACDGYTDCDENEEVFIDVLPPDSTSTELLIDEKPTEKTVSVSSEELDDIDEMQLEMAAGTPVVLDFLLNHPFTCAVQ